MGSAGINIRDTSWTFTCKYCSHENEEVDANYDANDIWADCKNCREQNEDKL
jgi:hypothetical protein